MFEYPDNSIIHLGVSVFLILVGGVGQRYFDDRKPPPSANPEAAAAITRRNKIYFSAFMMVIGFGACQLLHFIHAARLAGILW